MRPDLALAALTLFSSATAAAVQGLESVDVARTDVFERTESHQNEELWKRKGGGGGGGGRGGGGGGSTGGSSGGGGRTGGSGGSSGGGGARTPGRGGSSDNAGGSTRTGSGPRPAFGGGRYYGGGAAVPYKAGGRSPVGGIAPFFIGGAALAFLPGLWLYGAYMYPYHHPYTYYNRTAAEEQTKSVVCACDPYQPCGCDDTNDTAFLDSVVGDGDYNRLDKTVVNTGVYEGNQTIFLNGTLPNGTTAAGGEDEIDNGDGTFTGSSPASAASSPLHALIEGSGYWPMAAAVIAAVFVA